MSKIASAIASRTTRIHRRCADGLGRRARWHEHQEGNRRQQADAAERATPRRAPVHHLRDQQDGKERRHDGHRLAQPTGRQDQADAEHDHPADEKDRVGDRDVAGRRRTGSRRRTVPRYRSRGSSGRGGRRSARRGWRAPYDTSASAATAARSRREPSERPRHSAARGLCHAVSAGGVPACGVASTRRRKNAAPTNSTIASRNAARGPSASALLAADEVHDRAADRATPTARPTPTAMLLMPMYRPDAAFGMMSVISAQSTARNVPGADAHAGRRRRQEDRIDGREAATASPSAAERAGERRSSACARSGPRARPDGIVAMHRHDRDDADGQRSPERQVVTARGPSERSMKIQV